MKTLFAILKLYIRDYPGWFATGVVIAFVTALATITLLATAGWFLGATAVAGAVSLTTAIAFNTLYPGFLIRTAALTRTVGRYAERVLTHDATFRFLARMRLYVFDGISQMSFRRLRDFRSGELLARLTADIDALDGVYLRVVLPLTTALLATIALCIILHSFFPLLAIVVGLILFGSLLLMPWQAGKVGVKLGRRIAFSSEALRLRYIDLLRGQVELIMAGRLGDQVASINRAATKIRVLQAELSEQDLRGRMALTLASGLALTATVLLCAWAYEKGALSEALVLLSILAVTTFAELMAPIRRGLLDIGRSIYAGQRILPLMSETPLEEDGNREDCGPVQLVVEKLDFAYAPDAAAVLDDLSFRLNSGEAIGIVGSSGAGKSTLLGLVAGLLEPRTGRIRLEYQDACYGKQAPRLGLLTQRTELFRESLGFNLRIGDEDATDAQLEEAMAQAQLSNVLNRLPQGLEQSLGDDGQGLSGGESRRMALARLLLFKPDIWLLDEATEGLDAATGRAVLEVLKEATRDKALMFVTHKKSEAVLADRLLVLREGEAARMIQRTDSAEWAELLAGLR